jgi:hypothetical protein
LVVIQYTPLFDGDRIFQSPQKAWGEGHEMAIRTKEWEKKKEEEK